MSVEDISLEPIINKVAKDIGAYKGFRMVSADGSGNTLIAESLSWEIRFDYDTRDDGQPVYVGYAPAGTATSSAAWLIHKFTYDVSNFVTRRQVVTDKIYDNRATLF